MNAKIQKALTLLQAGIDEMRDTTTLKLELTSQEVRTLKDICWCNNSVPNAVVSAYQPSYDDGSITTKHDVADLLEKINDAL